MGSKLPHILLVVCDSLGAKHLPMYGYSRNTLPSLEGMLEGERWAVYRNCFSTAPWTLPSHASLFTGLYPSEHGADGVKLKLDRISFVEILREAGYATVGISSNHIVHRSFVKGWSDFYEVYGLIPSNIVMARMEKKFKTNIYKKGKLKSLAEVVKENIFSHPVETTGLIANKIFRRWINPVRNSTPLTIKTLKIIDRVKKSSGDSPLFVFANIMQTHHNYNPPDEVKGKYSNTRKRIETSEVQNFYGGIWKEEDLRYISDLYDEEILYLDKILKQLTDIWRDGIIIVMSDHGDLHGEHGCYAHMFTTYNDLVHIPLLVRWPREWEIQGEITKLCQINDIFATILEIVDSPFPTPKSSISLLSQTPRKVAIVQSLDVNHKITRIKKFLPSFQPNRNMQPMMSVITQDFWKITQRMDGSIDICDLNQDFYEDHSLESPAPDKTELLKALLEHFKRELHYRPTPLKEEEGEGAFLS